MPSEQSACVIGPQTQVVGEVAGEGEVVVAGRLQGRLQLRGHLSLAPGGLIEAEVEADSAYLCGRLSGPLTVGEHLEVADGAQLQGAVAAQTLTLAAGARVDGEIDMPLALPEAMH